MFRAFIIILHILIQIVAVNAQSLPVGLSVMEDTYRREQLLGKGDARVSFTVRPILRGSDSLDIRNSADTIGSGNSILKLNETTIWGNNKVKVRLLPLTWVQNYNSRTPYGWNDGSIITARGYQTQVSLGAFAKYGPLSVQLRPEFVYARNNDYVGLPTDHYDIIWAKYYRNYFNVIDVPEKFGEGNYKKAFWGQSNIRLTFDALSIGLSNENLWWGPGIRNSLIMSNNAPGFKHVTINTARPVNTLIGSFEGQMVLGRLENSGYLPPETNRVYEGSGLYVPKNNDSRLFSGFVLTYNPRWLPGLYLGMSRASQTYNGNSEKKSGDFFPLLQLLNKKDNKESRQYLSSMFFRWIWTEGGSEVYGEYGQNGSRSISQFLLNPDLSAAYLLGFRKIIPLNKSKGQIIQASLEFTELQQNVVPQGGGWYTNSSIRQGYTHNGQLIGAGIGPGSNLQSLDVSWFKGVKHIGFLVERYLHNNDLYYQIFADTYESRKHWIDMSYGISGDWNYKNLILSANATMIRSMNYHYVLYSRPGEYFVPGWDVLNYQVRFGITYKF